MATAQRAVYSIDTSSLIHGWARAYPFDNFPSFWSSMQSAIEDGKIVISIEALNELKKRDDELYKWCKRFPEFCQELDTKQQEAMVSLMGSYPRLVDTAKGRSGADPFVIALAQVHPRQLIVISQELPGKKDSPKIPDVCREERITCINLVDLIRKEGWRF